VNYLVPKRYWLSKNEDLAGVGHDFTVHLDAFGLTPFLQNRCCVGLDATNVPLLCVRKHVHIENFWNGLWQRKPRHAI